MAVGKHACPQHPLDTRNWVLFGLATFIDSVGFLMSLQNFKFMSALNWHNFYRGDGSLNSLQTLTTLTDFTSLACLEIDGYPELTSSPKEIGFFISILPQSLIVHGYWKDVKVKQVKIGQRLFTLQKVIQVLNPCLSSHLLWFHFINKLCLPSFLTILVCISI